MHLTTQSFIYSVIYLKEDSLMILIKQFISSGESHFDFINKDTSLGQRKSYRILFLLFIKCSNNLSKHKDAAI